MEHPFVTTPLGVIGGFVGLIFTPIFSICGLSILLALHRSGVVKGRSIRFQLTSYSLLGLITFLGLMSVSSMVHAKLDESNLSFAKLVATLVSTTSAVPEPEHALIGIDNIWLLENGKIAIFRGIPVYNVSYANHGKIAALGVTLLSEMSIKARILSDSEVAKVMEDSSTVALSVLDRVNSDKSEMRPVSEGGQPLMISVPNTPDPILRNNRADVEAFRKSVYLVTTIIYKDKNTALDSFRITQKCVYYAGTLMNYTSCGERSDVRQFKDLLLRQ